MSNQLNVEEYLNSLPKDVEVIDLSSRFCKRIPSLLSFTNLKTLNLYNCILTELPPLPEGLERLVMTKSKFETLPPLPSTLENLHIDHSPTLKYISAPLPINLHVIHIGNCSIESLPELPPNLWNIDIYSCRLKGLPELPARLTSLRLDHNCIESLPTLPPNLTELKIRNNPITRLPAIPSQMQWIDASNCEITHVPALPPSIAILCLKYNPLCSMVNIPRRFHYKTDLLNCVLERTPLFEEILYGHRKDPITPFELDELGVRGHMSLVRKRVDILNRFRNIYYALKFKRQLRDWLWLKVRLPRIERANHPDLLREALDNAEDRELDLEEVVENFGVR
jgi:hypothetical protein